MGKNYWTKRNGQLSLAGIKFWRSDWEDELLYVAGDGVHSLSTGSAYICILEHEATPDREPGVGADWETYWNILVEGGNGNVFIDVAQTAHGLVAGDYVRVGSTPNTYVPARANSLGNAVGVGFVVDVPDANHFILVQTGYVIDALLGSFVPDEPVGTVMYLSPTVVGGLTTTMPTTPGDYIKPVAIITEPEKSMWVLSDSPLLIATTPPGGVESVNDDGEGIIIVDNTDPDNPIIGIDVIALANDIDFIDALVANDYFIEELVDNDYFTTLLANDTNFISELTSNTTFQTLVNTFISGGGGGGSFGSWSTPISNGIPWQATSDGIVVVSVRGTGSPAFSTIEIKSDSSPTPTTVRVNVNSVANSDAATCPVKAGDYVTVNANAGFSLADRIIWWIPMEGGSNEKFVGTGEAIAKTYFNIQVPFGRNAGGASLWTGKANGEGAYSIVTHNSGEDSYTWPDDGTDTAFYIPWVSDFNGTGNQMSFDTGKEVILETVVGIGNGAYQGFFGLIENGSGARPAQGGNIVSVGFVTDAAGVLYIRSATGAAHTETAISSIADGPHLLRIEYDPGSTEARFYIDGILVGTITTNLPTSASEYIGIGLFNDTGDNYFRGFMAPSLSVEI